MSSPAPLQIELRFPRLIIAGYGSVVEARLEGAAGEELRNVTLELRSEAFENGLVERRVEMLAASSHIVPLSVRAQHAGSFPLEVRLIVGTARGQLTAQGHYATILTVWTKPDSLQSLSVTIGNKAFQNALFNEVNEAIKIGEIRDINQLISHVFPAAPWEPVALVWSGFPVVRGLKEGFVFAKRFELVRPLGQGGMGVVWLVKDSALKGRHIALKFLPQEVCHDAGAIDDLRDEVLKARDLSHENIVRIYDLIEADGTAAISMEYIEGPTLDAFRRTLPQKIFEVADVLKLLPALCGALDYAHQRGLIHHDIKPLNVMITQDGVVKVCDFGLAGSLCETKSKLSGLQQHSTSGTTPYMSPQHLLLGTRTVADDLYSLGATLYELMTSKPPFFRGDLRYQIENEPPPKIADRRAVLGIQGEAVPEEWERVIGGCMAKQPGPRPKSCAELLAALKVPPPATAKVVPSFSSSVRPSASKPATPSKAPVVSKASPPPWMTFKNASLVVAVLFIGWLGVWALVSKPKEIIKEVPKLVEDTAARQEAAAQRQRADALEKKAKEEDEKRLAAEAKAKDTAKPAPPPVPPVPKVIPLATPATATKDEPFINSLGMKFVPVPIGAGDSQGQRVLFSIWETRSKDYAAFVKDSGYDAGADWKAGDYMKHAVGREVGVAEEDSQHPAVHISYDDAVAFCDWLTKKDRASGLIGPRDKHRLPTDIEWSYGVGIGDQEDARASPQDKNGKLTGIYPWGTSLVPSAISGNYGDEDAKAQGVNTIGVISGYHDGYGTTAPVGKYAANRLGLYDLGGNVWEWTNTWWDFGSSCRVLRGASWGIFDASFMLSSYRFNHDAGYRFMNIGFRCVLAVNGS